MAVDLKTHIEYMAKLNERLVGGDIVDLAILPPAKKLLLSIKKRVATQGQNNTGTQMAGYSTKPIYVTPKQFIGGGFNPQGKRNFEGNTIGDRIIPTARLKSNSLTKSRVKYDKYTLVKPNLQTRKSMYLENGYKELRDIQGLRTDITNMKYSGKLLNDFQLEKDGESVIMGLTTEQSAKKYNGLSRGNSRLKPRGDFFKATDAELKTYLAESTFLITRLTRDVLNGFDLTATIS